MSLHLYEAAECDALTGLFSVIPVGIAVLSQKKEIIYHNEAADEILRTLSGGRGIEEIPSAGSTLSSLFVGRGRHQWVLPYPEGMVCVQERTVQDDSYGRGGEYCLLTFQRVKAICGPACNDCDLSVREYQVASLIIAGYTNGDIADALFMSVHTAKHHVESLMAKTGLHNRLSAAGAVFPFMSEGGKQA